MVNRMKQLKDEPYSQEEADAAAGLYRRESKEKVVEAAAMEIQE